MRSRTSACFGIGLFFFLMTGDQSPGLASPDSVAASARLDSFRAAAPITAPADTARPVPPPSPRGTSWPTWLIGLVCAVVGGVSGAVAAHGLDVRQSAQAARRATLREMVGSRHDVSGQPFTKALNEAIVVYGDRPDVIAAIEAMMQGSDNEKLYFLYSGMAKAAGVGVVSKDTFFKAFGAVK